MYETIFDTTNTSLPARRFSSSFLGTTTRVFREFNGIELCKARCADIPACQGVTTYLSDNAGMVEVCDGLSTVGTRAGMNTALVSRSLLKRQLGQFAPRNTIALVSSLNSKTTPFPPIVGALAAADFNGDGIADVAVGFGVVQSNLLLLSRGSGSAWASTIVAGGLISNVHKAADMNGDGLADLLLASAGNLWLFISTSNVTRFSFSSQSLAAEAYTNLEVADLDGDGDLDLVAVSRTRTQVHLYQNLGGGSFASSPFMLPLHANISTLVDVAVVGARSMGALPASIYATSFRTIAQNEGPFFGERAPPAAIVVATSERDITQLALGRFHEETQDVDVVYATNDGGLTVLPDGEIAHAVPLSTGFSRITSIQTADLTGTGLDDIVFAGSKGSVGAVKILRAALAVEGPAEYFRSLFEQVYQLNDFMLIGLADFNQDTVPDLLAASTAKFIEYISNGKWGPPVRLVLVSISPGCGACLCGSLRQGRSGGSCCCCRRTSHATAKSKSQTISAAAAAAAATRSPFVLSFFPASMFLLLCSSGPELLSCL
jgi:hypothetical protein